MAATKDKVKAAELLRALVTRKIDFYHDIGDVHRQDGRDTGASAISRGPDLKHVRLCEECIHQSTGPCA